MLKRLFKRSNVQACFDKRAWFKATALSLSVWALSSCAARQPKTLEQTLGPDKTEIVKQQMLESTHHVPFALASYDDYYDIARYAIEKIHQAYITLNAANSNPFCLPPETIQKICDQTSTQICAFILEKTYNFNGEKNPSAEFTTALRQASMEDFLPLAERGIDSRSPQTLYLEVGKNHTRISLVLLDNPQCPFQPTDFSSKYYEVALGMPGLDKALGESISVLCQYITMDHELTHVGDTRSAEELGKNPSLLKEILADAVSESHLQSITHDTRYLIYDMYLRAISSVFGEDTEHATQFDLARLLHQIDPQFPERPHEVFPQTMEKSIHEVWVTPVLLPSENPASEPPAGLTALLNETKRLKGLELQVENIQKNVKFPRPEPFRLTVADLKFWKISKKTLTRRLESGQLTPDALALAKFAKEGLEFFEALLARYKNNLPFDDLMTPEAINARQENMEKRYPPAPSNKSFNAPPETAAQKIRVDQGTPSTFGLH